MKKKIFLVLIWSIAAFCFYEFFKTVDFNRTWREIENADGKWLVMALLFNFSILFVWTTLWSVLVPKNISVSFSKLFQANSFMSTACNTLPFPGGHAVGLVLLARLTKIKHSMALSVLALDQMMEGIVKVVVLTLAASFSPLPEQMQQGIQVFIILIVIFSAAMFYAAHKVPAAKTGDEVISSSLLARVKEFISQWAAHLETLKDYRIFSLGLILSLAMMGMQALGIWAAQKSLGLELPFWTTILVMAALNLATILPVTPGNFGVYEATAFLIYKFSGLSAEMALSLAFLQHICFLIPMAGTGWIVLLVQSLNSFVGKNKERVKPY
ncbi:MAG: flippase-like domain-containing protein [Nitrospina sp.]|nr:flippase-like domain-containing protein [Nitrospina sp.]